MKTKEELNELFKVLKATHKYVFELTVPLDDEETNYATIFLRKADRPEHAMINRLLMGSDSSKAIEFILKTHYIGGDDVNLILNDDDAILACDVPLVEFIKKREASIKKK